jgi:hypothetical protein
MQALSLHSHRPVTRLAVRLAVTLGAVLSGCGHEPDKAVEAAPVPLARRIDKLLDDPTSLVLPGADATVASDAGATAADAVEAAPVPAPVTPAVTPAVAVQVVKPVEEPAHVEVEHPVVEAVKPTAPTEPVEKAGAVEKAEKVEKVAKPVEARKDHEEAKAEKKPREDKVAKEPVEPPEKKPPFEAVQVPEGADATELFYSGKRKLEAGNLQGAIADLRLSQQVRPSARTLTLLGRALFDAGELGQAAKVLQTAGNHDEAQLLLGTLYQQQGKTALARKVYEAFLKAHPDHAKAGWVQTMLKTL